MLFAICYYKDRNISLTFSPQPTPLLSPERHGNIIMAVFFPVLFPVFIFIPSRYSEFVFENCCTSFCCLCRSISSINLFLMTGSLLIMLALYIQEDSLKGRQILVVGFVLHLFLGRSSHYFEVILDIPPTKYSGSEVCLFAVTVWHLIHLHYSF